MPNASRLPLVLAVVASLPVAVLLAAAARSRVGDRFTWERHWRAAEAKGLLAVKVFVVDGTSTTMTSRVPRLAAPDLEGLRAAQSEPGFRPLRHTSPVDRVGAPVTKTNKLPKDEGGSLSFLGVEWHWWYLGPKVPQDERLAQTATIVPLWLPTAFSASLAGVFWHRWWRSRRRRARGVCPACGYDLRATPGRGPEGGEPAGGAGTSAAAASGPPPPDDPARRAA